MTLTKLDLVTKLTRQHDWSTTDATRVIESLLELLKSTLARGEDILISGFGRFSVRQKRERKGRNPSTGKEIIVSRLKVVTFSYSWKLREKLNNRPECYNEIVAILAPIRKTGC
ncbi:MAG: integration host factor subunit alpha [Deltaproteobacteria bacterium]|nr:integration host factor subunit alpha [Deltaproteobacteria bacterium]